MPVAYIGMGSNLGNRQAHLCHALNQIAQLPQTTITGLSSIYETEPVGGVPQDSFLNMVVELMVTLPAEPLLQNLLNIEHALGRVRSVRWGPRVIDLALLAYDELVYDNTFLTLPHPQLARRAFVLVPWAEIAPEFTVMGMSISAHLAALARCPNDVVLYDSPPRLVAGEYRVMAERG